MGSLSGNIGSYSGPRSSRITTGLPTIWAQSKQPALNQAVFVAWKYFVRPTATGPAAICLGRVVGWPVEITNFV
jgi:hypothetical protein